MTESMIVVILMLSLFVLLTIAIIYSTVRSERKRRVAHRQLAETLYTLAGDFKYATSTSLSPSRKKLQCAYHAAVAYDKHPEFKPHIIGLLLTYEIQIDKEAENEPSELPTL
jgi:hypothetical protein